MLDMRDEKITVSKSEVLTVAGSMWRRPEHKSSRRIERSLFDLENDPNETSNVIDSQPEVVERLKKYAESHKNRFYK